MMIIALGQFWKEDGKWCEAETKLFWKYARSRLKSRQAIPMLTNKDGTETISAKDKAETLNDFFTSVFTT